MSKERKRRTSQVDPNETPKARFKRLASKRVTKAVKAIRNIGSLSGRSYERTDDQVEAIVAHLKGSVKYVEDCFAAPDKAAGVTEIQI